MIRDALESDSKAISEIYNHYICHTVVSFEEHEIDQAEISNRVNSVLSAGLWWLVAEEAGRVIGYAYAYASRWKERSAYLKTVEVSVYLHPDYSGKGYGTSLYKELFTRLRDEGFHVAIGGIALPNPSSVKLHEKFGMEKVAHFREVGYKFGQWVDVGYWQVQLADKEYIENRYTSRRVDERS